ncbi:hypothetical protein ACFY12_16415 [Streptomyces sp. NPDC001339]|uniref:hypothetical protein n=1 Tax=Streptomyces sp. NPDC001339 TaxID=3364563 RepID=UPI0036B9B598
MVAVVVRAVVGCGQTCSPALCNPVNIDERLKQLDTGEMEFARSPCLAVKETARLFHEVGGCVELFLLHLVGEAGYLPGPVPRQVARLAVEARPRQQPRDI